VRARERERKRKKEKERERERKEEGLRREGEKWVDRGQTRDLDADRTPIVLPSSFSVYPILQNPPPLSTDQQQRKGGYERKISRCQKLIADR